MSQKVLAIINRPQECGEATIDFISLETGKVIDYVNIDGFDDSDCIRRKVDFVGDNVEIYINNIIGEMLKNSIDRHIGTNAHENLSSSIVYSDENCTIETDILKYKPKYNDTNTYYIRDIECIKRIENPEYKDADQNTKDIMDTYIHKYTLCRKKCDYIYVQENDNFYWSFKEKFNIELPYFERQLMDIEKDLLPMCAKLLNFEVINILHY